ncbi:SMAD/FHA domain-containing protein [Chlamydoabsidia padenii]|nr:SMAD/FHA domain-containing protein [Chlamydoabsidia padenii]
MRKGITLNVGRHSENKMQSNSLIFKSKVVSRQHAEIWIGDNNKVLIRDLGSSSGTFLNSERLSPANTKSEDFELTDGDILRIGTSYRGGIQGKCEQ